jgi:hypothetical protein
MPQYDSVAKKIYVNLRSTNETAEIDPATDTVVGISRILSRALTAKRFARLFQTQLDYRFR